jgi:hypothetical protein
MSTPESTPALEALKLHVLGLVSQAFNDALLLGVIPAANPALPGKPPAPAKEPYTSNSQVRAVLTAKWPAIGKRLRKLNSFPLAVLRSDIEQHYTPLPADMQGGDSKHLKWHATVSNSVRNWPSDKLGPPLVERVGNNEWRVTEYGRSIL